MAMRPRKRLAGGGNYATEILNRRVPNVGTGIEPEKTARIIVRMIEAAKSFGPDLHVSAVTVTCDTVQIACHYTDFLLLGDTTIEEAAKLEYDLFERARVRLQEIIDEEAKDERLPGESDVGMQKRIGGLRARFVIHDEQIRREADKLSLSKAPEEHIQKLAGENPGSRPTPVEVYAHVRLIDRPRGEEGALSWPPPPTFSGRLLGETDAEFARRTGR